MKRVKCDLDELVTLGADIDEIILRAVEGQVERVCNEVGYAVEQCDYSFEISVDIKVFESPRERIKMSLHTGRERFGERKSTGKEE